MIKIFESEEQRKECEEFTIKIQKDIIEKHLDNYKIHLKKDRHKLTIFDSKIIFYIARYIHEFNYYDWPNKFPFKPKLFDELENYSDNENKITKYKYASFWIKVLRILITEKEQYRYLHLFILKRTPEYFERWWYMHKNNLIPYNPELLKQLLSAVRDTEKYDKAYSRWLSSA